MPDSPLLPDNAFRELGNRRVICEIGNFAIVRGSKTDRPESAEGMLYCLVELDEAAPGGYGACSWMDFSTAGCELEAEGNAEELSKIVFSAITPDIAPLIEEFFLRLYIATLTIERFKTDYEAEKHLQAASEE